MNEAQVIELFTAILEAKGLRVKPYPDLPPDYLEKKILEWRGQL